MKRKETFAFAYTKEARKKIGRLKWCRKIFGFRKFFVKRIRDIKKLLIFECEIQ